MDAADLPDHLPGEPPPRRWSAAGTAAVLLRKFLGLVLVGLLALPFWPVYLLLRLRFERPPVVPSASRSLRCLRLVLTERQEPSLSAAMRAGLFLELLRRIAGASQSGCAWFLDEILYGEALDALRVPAPLFELSAARSGSTQIAHYLEDDPRLAAPSVAQGVFPFVWLWKLAPLLARVVSPERFAAFLMSTQAPEYLERHEMEPFRTDTFEMLYVYAWQFGDVLISLGPRVIDEELCFMRVLPVVREVWEDDFVRFFDRLGRKTLMAAPLDPEGRRPRLLVKGHFLLVVDELERLYPDARFLTVIRARDKRLQSMINFMRCQATVAPCPAVPWPWIVSRAVTADAAYEAAEQAWLGRDDGARRCVVAFDDYVRDLEGTMRRIYRECLDLDLPPHIPRVHAPRARSNYSVDRSLAELGIDAATAR